MKLLKGFREEMWQIGCDNKISPIGKNLWKRDSPGVKIYRQMTGLGPPDFKGGHNVPHHPLGSPHLVWVAVLAVPQYRGPQTQAQVESDLVFPPSHHLRLHEAGVAAGSEHLRQLVV